LLQEALLVISNIIISMTHIS